MNKNNSNNNVVKPMPETSINDSQVHYKWVGAVNAPKLEVYYWLQHIDDSDNTT